MAAVDLCEAGNLTVAMTAMANGFAASADRRTQRADQLAADSAAMWSVHLTTPTQSSAMAYRTAVESGSGRTRAETNNPAGTGAGT